MCIDSLVITVINNPIWKIRHFRPLKKDKDFFNKKIEKPSFPNNFLMEF